MAKHGEGKRPVLYLIENACACLNEGDDIGGNNCEKNIISVEGNVHFREMEAEKNNSANNRPKA